MILLLPVLMAYFWAVSVDPMQWLTGQSASPFRPWSWPIILKSVVALLPGAVVASGGGADGNPVTETVIAIGLVTLMGPVMIDSLGPSPGSPRPVLRYAYQWATLQAESHASGLIVGAIVGLATWALSGHGILPSNAWFQQALNGVFGVVSATPGHVALPFPVYVGFLAVLLTRITVLGASHRHGCLRALVALCATSAVWVYLYNTLLGIVVKDWTAPCAGLLGGLGFAFLVDWSWALVDAKKAPSCGH
jgi:hypothetical protein